MERYDHVEDDMEDEPEPSDIMGHCCECGYAIRRDEGNEILSGGDRVHLDCAAMTAQEG